MQQTLEQCSLPTVLSLDPTHWTNPTLLGGLPVDGTTSSACRPCRVQHALKLHVCNNIRIFSKSVFFFPGSVKKLITGCNDYCSYFKLDLLGFLLVINSICRAGL